MENTNDKIEYITEMEFTNGIYLVGLGETEEKSIKSATEQLPYKTNVAVYTYKDVKSFESYKLPQHYTETELA